METRNNQTVAFTGHRKERILQGSGNDSRILAQIREAVTGVVTELYGQGYKEYYTGMASGFDMTAAEAVLQVRERYEDIKLIAAVPFRKQPLWFEAEDQLLYARLLERMDRVVMVSENYHKGCYLRSASQKFLNLFRFYYRSFLKRTEKYCFIFVHLI